MINGSPSLGFGAMRFTIQEVDDKFAYGVNNMKQPIQIPLHLIPYKGALPAVGETWVIEQRDNVWAFSAILNAPSPPVVTGSRADGTALENLLLTLSEMGIIIDGTIPAYRVVGDDMPIADDLTS